MKMKMKTKYKQFAKAKNDYIKGKVPLWFVHLCFYNLYSKQLGGKK